MALSKKEFSDYIRQFKFRELFNDMGWNNDKTTQPIAIDTITYTLQGVAEKSGFKILLCTPTEEGNIPDYATRKKIETKVTKLFQEHLIIFSDAKKQGQVWQLVVRQTGKPVKVNETRYNISQDPELLYQRAAGLFFELDEEDKITIVDVKNRVSENFHQNNEKITKQFYDKFKAEHKSFLEFIKGIEDKVNKDWYASLMLNRLMFCYFIQKKGFLDSNKNYLRDKLKTSQEKRGKDKFYSFYRDFLIHLFHFGLGAPESDRKKETIDEIGKIPYLNGGLFDEHELERNHKSIEINDKAFERIFDFFDQYEWHLDTRITATGKDINPDVIGYIFEKYINDRAQMGAYYTKEDITDYISKNCIIPFLFNSKDITFDAQTLREHGEKYIYPAVKHGMEHKLPDEISAGIKNVSKRTEWNKPAPPSYGLPTEIWREVIERRTRYHEIKQKLDKGEITGINDFITYNLDIRQFAQDTIENTNSPDVLKAFYKALNSVTILDPTCGSGAFLFAAMNILEPLYESCIQRMENFVAEAPKGKFKYFEEILAQVKAPEHPNLQYFIYKSIILRNLYGVDIMKEAVEIAKLRLFLKLVATVEANYKKPNLGLEPLPDIDFNIRSGNSLVGFATETDLKKGLAYTLDGLLAQPLIEEKCDIVAKAFSRYKEIQLSYGDDYKAFKRAKEELQIRLQELNNELNLLLYKQSDKLKFDKWLEAYQPFHWFAEFYEIVNDTGGFDIIIGNPPYVVYTPSSHLYRVKNYETVECKDLYAFILERSVRILNKNGAVGMILPISIVSTDGFSSLRKLVQNNLNKVWYSNYAMRPAKLFEGVEKHLSIFIANQIGKKQLYSTKYYRWYSEGRETLFKLLAYTAISKNEIHNDSIPKVSSELETSIISKIKLNRSISAYTVNTSKFIVYHTRKLRYFLQFLDTAPKIYEESGELRVTSELKEIHFKSKEDELIANAAYLSSLFFWYYVSFSDCRNLNKREVTTFPFSLDELRTKNKSLLAKEGERLLKNLQENSYLQEAFYKKYGKLKMQVFQPRLSKSIIDNIDSILGEHYGLSEEELDFVINYDIKYRMGKELDDEE